MTQTNPIDLLSVFTGQFEQISHTVLVSLLMTQTNPIGLLSVFISQFEQISHHSPDSLSLNIAFQYNALRKRDVNSLSLYEKVPSLSAILDRISCIFSISPNLVQMR